MRKGRGVAVCLTLIGVSFGAMGCDDPITAREGDFSVTAGAEGVLVQNRSDDLESVHVILETRASELVDLVSCESWTQRLEPGEQELVPYDSVYGWDDEAESVLVYWCLLSGETAIDGGSETLTVR